MMDWGNDIATPLKGSYSRIVRQNDCDKSPSVPLCQRGMKGGFLSASSVLTKQAISRFL
jgi:hypothetical protein